MPSGLMFNVFGRDVSASSTLRRVEGQADSSASRIGGSFKKLGGLVAGAFAVGGVTQFFSAAFSEASEAQKVSAQTGAVIASTGGAAHVSAGQVSELSNAISKKVGIDDEAIQSGENMLLTFTNVRNEAGKGNDIFNQSTQIMTDMSVALGTDLPSSAKMLGKALNDPITGMAKLGRAGVQFTQEQKDQITTLQTSGDTLGAQKIILRELTREFGGSAAAQATDADKMKVAFGNVEEQVGTALMPVISGLANFLTNDVIPAFSATVGWLQKNWHWLKYVAGVTAALWVAWKGYAIISTAVTAIKTARAAFLGLALAEGAAETRAGKFGSALGALNTSGGRAGLAMAGIATAVIAAGVAITKWNDKGSAMIDLLGMSAEKTGAWRDALQQTNGVLDDNIRLMVAKQLQDSGLASKAAAAGISLGQLTAGVTGNTKAMDDLIAAWQASGDPSDETMIRLSLLHTQFRAASSSAKQLNTVTKDNTKVTKDAGAQQGVTRGALDKTTGSMQKQTSQTDLLSQALTRLSGDDISAAQAQLQFKDGVAQATQQVKDNGKSLDANTDKGRANREWLLTQISSINDVANAEKKAGDSVGTVTTRMGANEQSLRRAADAAGMNRDEVDKLIKKYAAVPSKVATDVIANTGDAQSRIAALINYTNTHPATLHVQIHPDANGIMIGGRSRVGISLYAQGTGYAPAGPAWVGEHGPELLMIPRGSRVESHTMAESAMRMAGGRSGGDVYVTVHVAGSVMAQRDLVGEIEKAVRQTGRINIGSHIR